MREWVQVQDAFIQATEEGKSVQAALEKLTLEQGHVRGRDMCRGRRIARQVGHVD